MGKGTFASSSGKGPGGNVSSADLSILANAKQGLDARGLPIRPEFDSVLNRETGQLDQGFRIGEFDPVNLDRRALDAITEQGLSTGPTAAAQRQLQSQQLEQAGAFDNLRSGQAGAQQQSFDALARQGGLSGGSRERLARSGQRNALLGGQNIRSQGAQQRAGILAQDETAKRNLLGQAQQGALAAGQFSQGNRQFEADRRSFDIQNALGELQSKRGADLAAFEADRAGAAAEKQAAAQRKAACFAEGTLLPMADGTYKAIDDVKIGESLKVGGVVHAKIQARLDTNTPIYDYDGVLVTGSHAVLEDGKWVRVEFSQKAVEVDENVDFVYNLSNELHLIEIAGVCFADYEETDNFSLSDEDSLALMNSRLNKNIKSQEERVAFC